MDIVGSFFIFPVYTNSWAVAVLGVSLRDIFHFCLEITPRSDRMAVIGTLFHLFSNPNITFLNTG